MQVRDMEHGSIPISKDYEIQFRYYDKDQTYKYFNRKFEVLLLEKKALKKNYLLHMDNTDTSKGNFKPKIYTTQHVNKKMNLGVTTLNWNDIKNNFLDVIVTHIGENHRDPAKKALNKLHSPKL